MDLMDIERMRFIDRNKIAGDALFDIGEQMIKAEFIFYIQGSSCLNIRLGRHDKRVDTWELEAYLNEHKQAIKARYQPEIERLRRERTISIYGEA